MPARDMVAWDYLDDNGVHHTRRGDDFYTSQAATGAFSDVGGAAAAGSALLSEMPRNLRPRAVNAWNTANKTGAWIVIYDPTTFNAITVGTTTFHFREGDGTSVVGTVRAKRGEGLQGTIKP